MDIYNFFNKKILKKSLPFYLPILLGIFYKLNTMALFIIPIQAIKSISIKRLSSRSKVLFDFFNIPIPNENNLFRFFFIIIIITLLTLIFSNILKKLSILRIKKKIYYINSRKKNKSKTNVRYYTKKFEEVNNYIGII